MALRRWSAIAKQLFERSARRHGIAVARDASQEGVHFFGVICHWVTLVFDSDFR